MVLTNTLDTQNLKEHCNGIAGYTESQGALPGIHAG